MIKQNFTKPKTRNEWALDVVQDLVDNGVIQDWREDQGWIKLAVERITFWLQYLPGKEKLYTVIKRGSGERGMTKANSAQEACDNFGWLIGDCFVKETIYKKEGKCG